MAKAIYEIRAQPDFLHEGRWIRDTTTEGVGNRFEFPTEIVLERLPSHSGWHAWIEKQANAGADPIDLAGPGNIEMFGAFPADTLAQLAVGGAGTIFCAGCGQTFPAAHVKVEKWEAGSTMGGALGRLLLCQRGHTLLRVIDQAFLP